MRRFPVILIVLVFLVVGFVLVIYDLNQPVSTDSKTHDFVVNKGDSLSVISNRLESQHLIKNRFIFIAQARILDLSKKLQAGKFSLSPAMTTREIVIKLSEPGSSDYWFKITPGTRVEEFAPNQDFLIQAKDLEGYLFPDSYLVPEHYSAAEIIKLVRDHFFNEFAKAKKDSAPTLSDSQIVTLASIVEREARTLPVKQLVAGILLNRLQINMALQVDATVQYARDSRLKKYWQPLSKVDLKIISPFNTYLNPGLPPTPICNPGYDSIFAAFHPTASDYFYYITDNNGVMHYAKTLDEHNLNILKYLK